MKSRFRLRYAVYLFILLLITFIGYLTYLHHSGGYTVAVFVDNKKVYEGAYARVLVKHNALGKIKVCIYDTVFYFWLEEEYTGDNVFVMRTENNK